MIKNKIKYYIYVFLGFIIRDSFFISIKYFLRHRSIPNLKHPKTFNERIAAFKLKARSPLYEKLADKHLVKDYVRSKIGDKYVIPSLYVTSNPDSINFNRLPNSFIIKANHGTSCNIIIRNKKEINEKAILRDCRNFLSINYYYYGRENQYFNINRKLVLEELMMKADGTLPMDYKFFTFNGEVKAIQLDIDRFNNHTRNFYDSKWNKIPVELMYPSYDNFIDKPKKLAEMINIASRLSADLDFARIDLYYHNEKIYFGEITLTPENNLGTFNPVKYDRVFGDYFKN